MGITRLNRVQRLFCNFSGRALPYGEVAPEDSKTERQQLIALRVDAALLAEIDAKRGRVSRSEFLRNAVYAELQSQGTELPASVTAAPDRAGKGGRPRKAAAIPLQKISEDEAPPARADRQAVQYPKAQRVKKPPVPPSEPEKTRAPKSKAAPEKARSNYKLD